MGTLFFQRSKIMMTDCVKIEGSFAEVFSFFKNSSHALLHWTTFFNLVSMHSQFEHHTTHYYSWNGVLYIYIMKFVNRYTTDLKTLFQIPGGKPEKLLVTTWQSFFGSKSLPFSDVVKLCVTYNLSLSKVSNHFKAKVFLGVRWWHSKINLLTYECELSQRDFCARVGRVEIWLPTLALNKRGSSFAKSWRCCSVIDCEEYN